MIDGDLAHIYRKGQLKAESRHEPLTKVFNRRGFEEVFNVNINLVKRFGHKLQLFHFDLNDFKQVIDTLGHEMGDFFSVICLSP